MTKEESTKQCLAEIAEIRKTLTPQYQVLLDKSTLIWEEMEATCDAHPEDGNAVMAQVAISLLIYSLGIPKDNVMGVAIATSHLLDALEGLTRAKILTNLMLRGKANVKKETIH